MDTMVRREDFGRDLGLVHEMVITGRKLGADEEFYKALAHDADLFRKVVKMVMGPFPGYVYNDKQCSSILGLPCACYELLPVVQENKITFFYGGWSLSELLGCKAGKAWMIGDLSHMGHCLHLIDDKKYEIGYYSVCFRYPRSNYKRWEGQVEHLRQDSNGTMGTVPTVIAASAALIHLAATGEDPLSGHMSRCQDAFLDGDRSTLCVVRNRLEIRSRTGMHTDHDLWIAAAKKDNR